MLFNRDYWHVHKISSLCQLLFLEVSFSYLIQWKSHQFFLQVFVLLCHPHNLQYLDLQGSKKSHLLLRAENVTFWHWCDIWCELMKFLLHMSRALPYSVMEALFVLTRNLTGIKDSSRARYIFYYTDNCHFHKWCEQPKSFSLLFFYTCSLIC